MLVSVRTVTEAEIPHLAVIERAAGETFRDIGMPEIADDEPLSIEVLERGASAGLLWVAIENDEGALPVAYLLAEALGSSVHIEQVTVHPGHARQGIGARLIDACEEWARVNGFAALTLTTFRDVPWNEPYYRRIGFQEIAPYELTAELNKIVQTECDAGLARWPRVVMRRPLSR